MLKFILGVLLIGCLLLYGCAPQQPVQIEPSDLSSKSFKVMSETALQLQVTGYEKDGSMPSTFATKDGGGSNVSIGLKWQSLPAAQSYALLFDDKHPVANNWVHWLVVDIPNTANGISEGASRTDQIPTGSRELMTSWGETGYGGPQPPVGSGDHEYVATLYALDVPKLDVDENISRSDFLKAIEGHVIAKESYSGWFERK